MGLRPAVTDPDTIRSTPPPGDPAQLPERCPLPGPPATKPAPSPPRARLLIDLRPDQLPVPEPLRSPVEAPGPLNPGTRASQTVSAAPAGPLRYLPEEPAALVLDPAPPAIGATALPDVAVDSSGRLPGTHQPALEDEPGDGAGEGQDAGGSARAWPEVRFYLGAFSLFFVSYVLVTALLVAGATVLMGLRPVAVTSGSMEPVIRMGDVVMFAAPPEEPVGPGTVVGFDEPGTDRPVTHRVVRANPDGTYVTQGDANPEADPQLLERDGVWGVGRLLIPYAGYPATWLAMGAGWKLGILVMFLLGCGFSCRWAVLEEYNPWQQE